MISSYIYSVFCFGFQLDVFSVFSLMSFRFQEISLPFPRDVLKEHPRKITLFFTNSQTYYYQSSEIISKKLRGKTITAQQKHNYRILGTALPRTGYRITTLRLQGMLLTVAICATSFAQHCHANLQKTLFHYY